MNRQSEKLRVVRGASSVIQLVVTRAKAKPGIVRGSLQLHSVRQGLAGEAAADWVRSLSKVRGGANPAVELYRGDHWRAAVDAGSVSVASGGRAWVCPPTILLGHVRRQRSGYCAPFRRQTATLAV